MSMISASTLRNAVLKSYYFSSIRTISTSQILCRRRLAFHKDFSPILTVLDSSDLNLIEEDFKQIRSTFNSNVRKTTIDFSNRPLTGETFTDASRRTGMVGIKIGMLPQWCTNRGERVLCTAIHFPSNEVISVVDPETWYKTSEIGKRKAYTRYGPMYKVTVGAGHLRSLLYVTPFDKLLMKRGLNPKQHYGSFLVTEDGIIPPGTNLDVRHFNIGQYVNVTGRTIDWGFQGAMHRWGFRGLPDRRQVTHSCGLLFTLVFSTTKAHRRVGSIGIKGDARVWPGQRLPGHMGHEWRQTSGLEILRINPTAQVIYVKGCVAGSCGSVVLMNDCLHESKRAKDVSFPTFVPEKTDQMSKNVEEMNLAELTSQDLYADQLFRFSSPSIVFTDAHEKKSAARDKTRAKIAKVKK